MSKNCVYVAEYIKKGLENLKFDVQHFFSCPMNSKTYSKSDKNTVFMYYDQVLEWLMDYNGLVDVIVNESPIAKFAFVGAKCFDEAQKASIIRAANEFNNFNIFILDHDTFDEGSEEDKLMDFLVYNGISSLMISKTNTHLDQIIKDIEDKLLPAPDPDYYSGTDIIGTV